MPSLSLSTPITSVPMIGPSYAKHLIKLGILTVSDLLHHYPHRHEDLTVISPINSLTAGQTVTIKGTVISAQNIYTKSGKRLQKAIIADGTGQIEATWFNQPYVVDALSKAESWYFSGKTGFFGPRLSLASPQYEADVPNKLSVHTARLVPIYPETAGVSSKWLRSRIFPLLGQLDNLVKTDFLPPQIIKSQNFISLSDAIKQIHFPDNQKRLTQAKDRLAFDELFLLQLASGQRKSAWHTKKVSHAFKAKPSQVETFLASLPFTLTGDQLKANQEILADLTRPIPMNRLLQGDVGAGKTVVAAIAVLVAKLNGFKSVILAPTSILATQHFHTLKGLLGPFDFQIDLVTGTTAKKVKSKLIDSSADLIIGTHALLFNPLPSDIGLLIIDEQHRFGVAQRSKLLKLPAAPHLLSMTATPIPRTVALTVYGELDLSVIEEMPAERKPIKTWVIPTQKRASAYDWIREQITAHQGQAFIVCPLIEESASLKLAQVKAVEIEYQKLKSSVFPDLKLGFLHGRLKSGEKQAVLNKFDQGKIDILVSTPVIEVGIDIRSANIMLIEGSERFGLAQLHQLRGRVGRGDRESYCLLFSSHSKATDLKRLQAMTTHHSGFSLAEIDLKLRGPGDMFGMAQHGFSYLKLANFSDAKLIKTTHSLAKNLIQSDPKLTKHPLLAQKVLELESSAAEPN